MAHIGTGGMGEVYRARDTNLEKDVAVKVIAEAFASDATALPRFDRERRVGAVLEHPHICRRLTLPRNDLVIEFARQRQFRSFLYERTITGDAR